MRIAIFIEHLQCIRHSVTPILSYLILTVTCEVILLVIPIVR